MRTSTEVCERRRLIRNATPNILEELFEMQKRLCDLCEQPIQDLILAELDHSVPVAVFARGPLNIDEAVRLCKDPSNLRCAHALCNRVKHDMTREQWYAEGRDKTVGTPKVWTAAKLQELRFRLGAGGRVSGKIVSAARKNAVAAQKIKRCGLFSPAAQARAKATQKIKRSERLCDVDYHREVVIPNRVAKAAWAVKEMELRHMHRYPVDCEFRMHKQFHEPAFGITQMKDVFCGVCLGVPTEVAKYKQFLEREKDFHNSRMHDTHVEGHFESQWKDCVFCIKERVANERWLEKFLEKKAALNLREMPCVSASREL
jgi:hypothetical protein